MTAPIQYEILKAQSAIETTPGTGVPGNKLFTNLSIVIDPDRSTKNYKAQGVRANSTTVPGRKKTTGTIKGPGDYYEGAHLVAMIDAPVITTLGTSGATKFVVSPSPYSVLAPKTRTIEWGDGQAARGFRSVYNALSKLGLKTTPDMWEWDGATIGKGRERHFTLTASPTWYPQRIISPTTAMAFFVATTWAGLDTATPLAHCFGLDLLTDGWVQANNPADRTQPSFGALLAGKWKGTGQIKLGTDADSDQFEDALDNATKLFVRVQALGDLIGVDTGTNYYYTAQASACVNVGKAGKPGDTEGALTDDYPLEIGVDPVSGKMLEYLFISDQTTL